MDLKKKVDDLTAQIDDLQKQLEDAKKAGGDTEALTKAKSDLAAAQAACTAATEERDALKAEKAKKDDMDEDEKEFLEDEEDDKEKKKFLDMSKADRKKLIAKKRDGDETVEIEGRTIRKSKVGDDTFHVLKAQQDRIEKGEKERAVAVDKAETVELKKRAETDLDKMPGTVDEKTALLKSVAKLPEAQQKTFTEMMKAGNGGLKAAFEKVGHSGGDPADGGDAGAFMKKVEAIQTSEKCNHQEAMVRARKRHPKEFEAYQDSGVETTKRREQ